jgi:hypothetical protein
MITAMVEIIIERWTDPDRSVQYRWSVWQEGRRVHMGGPHASPEQSDAEAHRFCREALECQPDRVTKL